MNIDPTRRPVLSYDPLADMRDRWPDWRFECRTLPDADEAEAFLPDERLIELDSGYFDDDWELALAHAVAHLDLHLESLPESFSDQQCMDAVFAAAGYAQVSMSLNSFGVQPEEGLAIDADLTAY